MGWPHGRPDARVARWSRVCARTYRAVEPGPDPFWRTSKIWSCEASGRMFIMEVMGKARRARRAFTPEFKAEIVALVRRGDRSINQIAQDFDLAESAVREWVRKADGGR